MFNNTSTNFSFGSTNPTANNTGSVFGQTAFNPQPQQTQQTTLFGAKSSTGFGTFGASTSTATAPSLFGSTNQPTTGVFGSSVTAQGGALFGGNVQVANAGTSVAKFNPLSSQDTIQKNGSTHTIHTKHHCISAMKEYESKSLEELRMEDYAANRKGPTGGGIGSFGTISQPNTASNLFNSAPSGGTSFFGASATNPAKPMFGTSTGSTFGAAQTGSMFGAPAKSTNLFNSSVATTTSGALNLFGAPQQASSANTGFAFGQSTTSNAAGSLFGNKPGGFGTATTSSNTLGSSLGFSSFGQPQNQQPTNLFGAKPATNLFGGSATNTFGAPASSATAPFSFNTAASTANTGLFGQPSQAKAPFGFNTAAGTGTSTSFGFGTNTSTPSMGFAAPAPAGAGIFGNTNQAKPLFGTAGTIGATPNTGSAFSFGGGGGTGLTLGGGLGQTQQPAFGFNTAATNSTFGGAGSMFGNQQQPPVTSIGLSSDPQQAMAEQARIQQQVFDLVRTMPYGHSDLFKSSFLGTASTADSKSTTPNKTTGLMTSAAALKSGGSDGRSPGGINRLSLKPVSRPQFKLLPHSRKMLFSGFDEDDVVRGSSDSFFQRRSHWKRLDLRGSTVSGGSVDRHSVLGSDRARASSPTERSGTPHLNDDLDTAPVKKETPKTASNEKLYPELGELLATSTEVVSKKRPSVVSSTSTPLPAGTVSKPPCLPPTSPVDCNSNAYSPRNHLGLDSSSLITSDTTMWNNDPDSFVQPDSSITSVKYPGGSGVGAVHPCGIVLSKPGYYTLPSLEEIADQGLDDNQQCWIEDFVIGRKSYGRILFPGKTNVANLNIDDNVHIRRKEVTVYPDDDNKPPVGQSINRLAEVTLDRVWPTDKTTRQPIDDPERLLAMNFEQKLEKNTFRMGARFIEYRPDHGSWVFEVKHFSKYRYEDSDDEDNETKPVKPADDKQNQGATPTIQSKAEDKLKLAPSVADTSTKEEVTKLGSTMKSPSAVAAAFRPQTKPTAISTPRAAVSSTTEMEAPVFKLTPIVRQAAPTSTTVDLDDGSEAECPPYPFNANEDSKMKGKLQRMTLSLFEDMEDDDDEEAAAISNDLSLYRHSKRPTKDKGPPPLVTSTTKWRQPNIDQLIHSPAISESVASPFANYQTGSPRIPRVPSASSNVATIAAHKLPPTQLPDRKPADILPSCMPRQGFIQPRPRIPQHLKLPTGVMKLPLTREKFGDYVEIKNERLQLSRLFLDSSSYQQTCQRVSWCLFSGRSDLQTFCYLTPKWHSTAQTETLQKSPNILISSVENPDNIVGHLHPTGQQISIETLSPVCDEIDEDLLNRALRSSKCISDWSTERRAMEEDASSSNSESDNEFGGSYCAPLWTPMEELLPLNSYREVIGDCKSESFRRLVLLCCELWGRIDTNLPTGEDDSTGTYTRLERAQALSRWIRHEVMCEVTDQLDSLTDPTDRVFCLLTSGDAAAACREAQSLGLERTARLISGCSQGGKMSKRMILQQLQIWRGDDNHLGGPSDEFIPDSQIKLFTLLCGITEWEKSNGQTVSVLKDLSWLRAFAVFLWFNPDAQTANLSDSIAAYKRAFKSDNEAIVSKPWAHQATAATRQWDSAYHLIQLFCKRSHRLDKLLDPGAISATAGHQQGLDWQTSWHLWRILDALGYSHLSKLRSCQLHCEWAAQLENCQLWEWGVFALLHIRDNQMRNKSVRSFLARHVTVDASKELSPEEDFIVNRLKVPQAWIHEAKAILARHKNLVELEAHHWYEAGHYDKAHSLYMEHLAPDYLISKKLLSVKEIFAKFVDDKVYNQVSGWDFGGGLYLEQVQMQQDVLDLGEMVYRGGQDSDEQELEYRLRTLRLKLGQVIDRLDALPTATPRDRLVRSECSLYCSRLLELLVKHSGGPSRLILQQRASLIRELALSDDKRIQELKSISASMETFIN